MCAGDYTTPSYQAPLNVATKQALLTEAFLHVAGALLKHGTDVQAADNTPQILFGYDRVVTAAGLTLGVHDLSSKSTNMAGTHADNELLVNVLALGNGAFDLPCATQTSRESARPAGKFDVDSLLRILKKAAIELGVHDSIAVATRENGFAYGPRSVTLHNVA